MSGLFEALLEQASAFSILESLAVLAAVAYLVLAIRLNIWCWLFAGISTALYVYVFIDARLYMESALNLFYFGMAIYGWRVWAAGRNVGHERPVTTWPTQCHAIAIAAIVAVALMSGFLLSGYTDAAFPYIDSLTTFAAIWATFLIARKVLENWWYWLVIDVASIFIYWMRSLELTSLLFVAYVVMIPFGLMSWSRAMREASA